MSFALLGVLGALVGSYLNVLATRFSPEAGFKLSRKGRSQCQDCGKTLQWYELIPFLSFLFQGGKCRSCKGRLSFQYPVVEFLSLLVFILVPWKLGFGWLTVLWILVFLTLILMSVIDLRLGIIPDKLNLWLAALAFIVAGVTYAEGGESFMGSYGLLFQLGEGSFWIARLTGVLVGLVFFGGIYLLSRGKGMGLGDVKLAGALGLLLGWPDILLALILSFLAGSVFAIPLLIAKIKKRKDALPFGPFIAIGVTLVFFFGYHILNGYFQLFTPLGI